MNARYILQNLMLVERNKEWLSSGISTSEKLRYYPAFMHSYVRLVATKQKHIRYLGQKFYYDNPATPFNLQNYPYEITNKILSNMSITPKYVLDIGGNIGQFPTTIASIIPSSKVDALEPNGDIFEILQKNIKPYNNIKAYNVGVGKTSSQNAKMFYEPTRSGTGSLLAENAGDKGSVKEIPISLIDDVASVTKRTKYDLITIDVEGFEMDVVKCLKNVSTRYLFIEVSTQGRTKTYSHSDLFKAIQASLGDFDIVYNLGYTSNSTPTFDMLLEFKQTEKKKA